MVVPSQVWLPGCWTRIGRKQLSRKGGAKRYLFKSSSALKIKGKRGGGSGLHSGPCTQSYQLAPCRGGAARSLGSTLTRISPTGGFRSGHSGARAFLSLVTPSLDPELKTLGLPWSALQVASFVTMLPLPPGLPLLPQGLSGMGLRFFDNT